MNVECKSPVLVVGSRSGSGGALPVPDVARAALVIAAFALLACDPGVIGPERSAACTESGSQCLLENGPLGVCERVTCAAGVAPPCFQCTPQH